MTRTSVLALVLLPSALAIAAPRGRKKPPKKATTPVKDTATEPATPTPDPTPEAAKDAAATTVPPSATPATPAAGSSPGAADKPAAGDKAAPDKSDKSDKAGDKSDSAPADGGGDVDTLRQEYLSLRDELFKSRARASTVASQLYSTRVQIKLTYTTARFYNPAKASIRLDGAGVYEDATGAIAGDDGVRFDGYVAPGRHLITFHVEATGKDDDSFTSATETQIVVKAVAGKDLVVAAKAKDSGDIAYEWQRKERGSYGLGIDVAIKTIARADGGAAPAPAPAPAKAAPAKGPKK